MHYINPDLLTKLQHVRRSHYASRCPSTVHRRNISDVDQMLHTTHVVGYRSELRMTCRRRILAIVRGGQPVLASTACCFVRRRRPLQTKAFCVYSFDATAQQRLDGFSPNIHQKSTLRCYSLMVIPDMKIGPLPRKKNRGSKRHFLSENSDSAVLRRPLRGNEDRRNFGKTK